MLTGYDISQHQAATPDLSGDSFIVLRATINQTADTKYATHYANARKAGVVVMAYHFNGPSGSDIAAQVAKFLAVAKDADYLWLDQEKYNSTTPGFTDAEAQKFIDLVRAAGKPCGLYHSSSGFGGVNADAQWVADWRSESVAKGYPRKTTADEEFPGWDLWQYNGGGADNLDNNYLNPATTLAKLLRDGYVTEAGADDALDAAEAACDAKVEAAVDAAVAAADERTAALLSAKDATISAQAGTISQLEADVAAAASTEKERIALAHGEKHADEIRGL